MAGPKGESAPGSCKIKGRMEGKEQRKKCGVR